MCQPFSHHGLPNVTGSRPDGGQCSPVDIVPVPFDREGLAVEKLPKPPFGSLGKLLLRGAIAFNLRGVNALQPYLLPAQPYGVAIDHTGEPLRPRTERNRYGRALGHWCGP